MKNVSCDYMYVSSPQIWFIFVYSRSRDVLYCVDNLFSIFTIYLLILRSAIFPAISSSIFIPKQGCHLSQNCLVCESKVIFVLSHARYSLDTTIERKLSPSAIHFPAASILARRYKNCIAALLAGAPVLKIQ